MPHLRDGDERCALPVGTYTLGGNGADALPITRLESCPPVATIVVSADEAPTIQRLTARVVVQLDRVPLGIAAKPLHDGAVIEFADCSLVFIAADDSLAGIVPSGRGPSASEPWTGARIVNVRTGESITLGRERAVIGRDESCSLVVRAMRVSRRHFSVVAVACE